MREARSARVPVVAPAAVVDCEAGVKEVDEVEGGVDPDPDCCCLRGEEVVIMRLKVIDGA